VWAAQTIGHATNGTFPAGGPATAALDGPGGAAAGPTRRLAAPPQGGFGTPPSLSSRGAMFGGDSTSLTQAIAYADAHGGGTIAVASQTGAASSIIRSGADVVGIGGFSGRESQVTTAWLADAVASGQIRYVLASGGDGLPNDGRTGADAVLAAVKAVGKPVSSVSGLYDLRGLAAQLGSR
jgi:hypothetical protein